MTKRREGAMTRAEAAAIARQRRMEKMPPLEERFWSKVERRGPDECWPWMAAVRKKNEGYGAFHMNGRHHPAHRVAWELTNGKQVPIGMVACHACDNPRCCNPAHIWIGTNRDNDADRVKKGRQAWGERNAQSKLTTKQAWAMRRMHRVIGAEVAVLAKVFGVDHKTASVICKGTAWRHITPEMERRFLEEMRARSGRFRRDAR